MRLDRRLHLLSRKAMQECYTRIAEIDAVKNSWQLTRILAPQRMSHLTQSVIVTSSGASNRIEGNLLTDAEVRSLYARLDHKKFRTRDEQEVAGYIETLETILRRYKDIMVTESNILWLHSSLLKHCTGNKERPGRYKVTQNLVEARDPSGALIGILFEPTPPHLVKKEMMELIDWAEPALKNHHPLLVIANFIFEILAIHPFLDGNGRTSRLLSNLMLMRNGYTFTSVSSHENLIESRKEAYYGSLRAAQATWKSSKEDVTPWILFFLEIVRDQARSALQLLQQDQFEKYLSEKQLRVWEHIVALHGATFTRKSLIESTGFPARTVESIVKKLLEMNKIERYGEGRASRYQEKA